MKKILTLAMLLAAACGSWSCSDDHDDAFKLRVLTFEDADYRGSSTVTGYWSSLVDDPQYNGALLYGNTAGYNWYDEGNTGLASGMLDADFWNGGHAVSDYYEADFTGCDYNKQLAVSTAANGAGHNGSKHFCVQNGYVDASSYKQVLPALRFRSGEEHVIDHMWVVNTSYVLDFLTNGNAFSSAAGADSWFKIIATGYDAAGAETGTCEFFLCEGRTFVTEWTRFDLWQLGAVARVEFNLKGSDDLYGDYGLNAPAYFAFDDVAVRF